MYICKRTTGLNFKNNLNYKWRTYIVTMIKPSLHSQEWINFNPTFFLCLPLFALSSLLASPVPVSRSWSPGRFPFIPGEVSHFVPVPLPLRARPFSALHLSLSFGPLVPHVWCRSVFLPFLLSLLLPCRGHEWRRCSRAVWGNSGSWIFSQQPFMEVQLKGDRDVWWKWHVIK